MDFLKAEFQFGESKTESGEGRIVPLNQAALGALKEWRGRWLGAKPEDYIFPSAKLMFKGEDAPDRGVMTPYDVDYSKPRDRGSGRGLQRRNRPKSSAASMICDTILFRRWHRRSPGLHHSGNQWSPQSKYTVTLQPR